MSSFDSDDDLEVAGCVLVVLFVRGFFWTGSSVGIGCWSGCCVVVFAGSGFDVSVFRLWFDF